MPEDLRLATDPSTEVCPDFASDIYAPLRDDLQRGTAASNEDIVVRLVELWSHEHNERMRRWNTQQAAAAQAADEAELQRQAQEAEAQRLAEQEAERERSEAEKKKLKINDFDETKQIPSVLPPCPSQYALQKLCQFEYVELWYFSPDAYREAVRESRSIAEDALGVTKKDDMLTLKPAMAVKASKNALLDHELPIADFFKAKNAFLQQATQAGWPAKHIDAISLFFWNLEVHPMRETPHGDEIILTYASRVRRQWHDDLKMKTAGNISFINATLLQNIGFEVGAQRQEDISRRQEEQLTKVCSFPFSITVTWLTIRLHSLPPLMLPCFTHIIPPDVSFIASPPVLLAYAATASRTGVFFSPSLSPLQSRPSACCIGLVPSLSGIQPIPHKKCTQLPPPPSTQGTRYQGNETAPIRLLCLPWTLCTPHQQV